MKKIKIILCYLILFPVLLICYLPFSFSVQDTENTNEVVETIIDDAVLTASELKKENAKKEDKEKKVFKFKYSNDENNDLYNYDIGKTLLISGCTIALLIIFDIKRK